jgi:hypothetical protein
MEKGRIKRFWIANSRRMAADLQAKSASNGTN